MRPSGRHTLRSTGTSSPLATQRAETQCGAVPLSVEQNASSPHERGRITDPLKQCPMTRGPAQTSDSPVAGQREASQCAPPTIEQDCPAGHGDVVGAPLASQWRR